jgi:hypothetical protein
MRVRSCRPSFESPSQDRSPRCMVDSKWLVVTHLPQVLTQMSHRHATRHSRRGARSARALLLPPGKSGPPARRERCSLCLIGATRCVLVRAPRRAAVDRPLRRWRRRYRRDFLGRSGRAVRRGRCDRLGAGRRSPAVQSRRSVPARGGLPALRIGVGGDRGLSPADASPTRAGHPRTASANPGTELGVCPTGGFRTAIFTTHVTADVSGDPTTRPP